MNNLKKLNPKELVEVTGGNPLYEAAKWLVSYAGGKVVDELVDYANDPDRKVDLNHARNGGFQM